MIIDSEIMAQGKDLILLSVTTTWPLTRCPATWIASLYLDDHLTTDHRFFSPFLRMGELDLTWDKEDARLVVDAWYSFFYVLLLSCLLFKKVDIWGKYLQLFNTIGLSCHLAVSLPVCCQQSENTVWLDLPEKINKIKQWEKNFQFHFKPTSH